MFGRFRKDPFHKALQAIGFDQCSVTDTHLNIGLAPQPPETQPMSEVPKTPRKVNFFAAPAQVAVIEAFVQAPQAQTAQTLFIGTSHDYAQKPSDGWDFRAALAPLRGRTFPTVTTLILGEMEMLFNGEPLFGDLGDIGFVLDAFPALETLDLYGSFNMDTPAQHDRLHTLSVQVDGIHVGSDEVTQDTIDALLTSRFPALQSLDLDVDDGSGTLQLPAEDTLRDRFPNLRALSLDPDLTPRAISIAVHVPGDSD